MKFIFKILLRVIINIGALYCASIWIAGFSFAGTWKDWLIAGVILTIIHLAVRPLLKFVLSPLILLTFGLFTIIINMFTLFLLDTFSDPLTIQGYAPLFLGTLIVGFAHAVFHAIEK